MLRFIDGGDHLATADINLKWNNSYGVTVSSGTGRFAGNSLKLGAYADGSFLQVTLDNQATWIVGMGLMPSGFPSTSAPIIRLLDAGTQQVELRLNPDGTLSVTRNGTSVSGGTSSFALRAGTYYFIELKVTIADAISANTCKVNVNGATVITVTTGQDLQNTANATANSVTLHGPASNSHIDDVFVCDGTGTANNDFLGDCRVVTLLPNAAGDKSEMAVTGAASNYLAVNGNPQDGDTSYVSSSTTGQIDLYNLADLTLTGTIKGVQIDLTARKDDAGARQMAAVVKSGGTEYAGATFNPGTSYLVFRDIRETDPATGVAWVAGGVNALQAGPKLVA